MIPVLVLFLYLIIIGGIKDFINYAVLGIKTFSNSIPYYYLLLEDKIVLRILALVVPMVLFISVFTMIFINLKNKKSKRIDMFTTIFCYSFAILILMYPIADEIHFLLGAFVTIIELIYLLYICISKGYEKINIEKKYKIYKIISLLVWLLIVILVANTTLTRLYTYIKQNKNKELQHYKYVEVKDDMKNNISIINNYILQEEQQGNNVYILDAEAAIYMIPLNRYNKNYDMFLKGNLGKDGEEGIINELKNKDKNNIYMIRHISIEQNWQAPMQVIDYIRNNYRKIGVLKYYEVYK